MTRSLTHPRPTPIPGPPGHPLLGMAPAMRRDLLGTLLDGFTRYGDLVTYRFGPRYGPARLRRNAVGVYHPELVHRVLTNPAVFGRDTVAFGVLTELIGDGLLTTDGETWLRQRRTLQPLFTPRRVTGYAELMAAEAARVVDDPTVRSGSVVDLHALMQRYTVRVVGRALFGADVDAEVPALTRLVPLGGDLTLARTMSLVRTPLSWPNRANRRFTAVRDEQYEIVDRILARRGRTVDAGPGGGDDLVSRLVAARDPETGQPLSSAEIRDQILVFLLAGHETTAGALTFTLHQLGRHPEIQERVAEVAASPPGTEPRQDVVRAALLEGMRLFPPAYSTERRTEVDTELDGHPMPAGSAVFISSWVTHRHPAFWPSPGRYDPDRFLGDHHRPRYAYFPFGGGARSCIGEQFAMLEGTVLLRALLTRYRVTTLDESPRLVPLITLRPAEPVRARLIAR